MSDLNRRSIIALFLFAFFLRFLLISKGPYHADTLLLAETSSAILRDGRIHYLQASGLPLTALLGTVFILLNALVGLRDNIEAVNVMSVMLSSLSVCFFFLFAQRLFNKTVAWVSALVLLLHPTFWALSTFGNSHIPAIFFFVLGLNTLVGDHDKQHGRTVLAGFLFGLAGSARLQTLILGLPAILVLFTAPYMTQTQHPGERRLRSHLKDMLWLLITMLATALVFYIPKLAALPAGSVLSALAAFFHSHIMQSYTHINSEAGRLGLEALFGPFTIGGVLLAMVGLWKCWQQDKMMTLFLLTWIVVPSLFYCGFIYIVPRFFALPALAMCLLVGLGLDWAIRRHVSARLLALGLLSFSLICTTAQILPVLVFRHQHDLIVNYYQWLETQTEPHAQIMDRDNSLFMTKYAQRQPLSLPPDLVNYQAEALSAFKDDLERKLADGQPVYTTAVGLFGFNPDHRYPEFMDQYFHFELVGTHLFEDWHRGCLRQDIHYLPLFRVYVK
jgi:4-amino-4-deoxy-L-arabinose transferase-like glycosyltransferase